MRLRNAYVIRCDEVIKDAAGTVTELRCSVDPDTLGKNPEGRKVKGVIHWVAAETAVRAEVRLYDRLFSVPQPGAGAGAGAGTGAGTGERDFREDLNPDSLRTLGGAMLEPSLAEAEPGTRFQFEREGYFVVDADSTPARPVFNRTVTLRDTWAKAQGAGAPGAGKAGGQRGRGQKAPSAGGPGQAQGASAQDLGTSGGVA